MRKNDNDIKDLTDKLEKGITDLFQSDKYKEYLAVMSKFTNYSFQNSLLIALQRPDTQAVAGYRSWETNFERHVLKGSSGIRIIQPAPYKRKVVTQKKDASGNIIYDKNGDPETETVEKIFPGYKVGYVFAYEDTEGKPLPEIAKPLTADVENYHDIIQALKNISPAPIIHESIKGGANGYYDLMEKNIHIQENLPQLQEIKTTLHEVSHALLHDKDKGLVPDATKREREVQAESIAYVVCNHYGLDTSDYSFGYIAGWSSSYTTEELKAGMEIIRKTSKDIISAIDDKLIENQMIRETHLAFKNGTGYCLIERLKEGYEIQLYDLNMIQVSQKHFLSEDSRIDTALKSELKNSSINIDTLIPIDYKDFKSKIDIVATDTLKETIQNTMMILNIQHQIKIRR